MQLNNKIDYLEDGISIVECVDHMLMQPALKTANSARISYNKVKTEFDEKDTKLTTFLWDEEHTSPFRHTYFTFHIKAPIFLFRQLMKYQVGSGFSTYEVDGKEVSLEVFDHFYDIDKGCSWNEVSGRYTQTSEEFYVPKKLRSNPPHGNKQSSGEYDNPLDRHDIRYMDTNDIIRDMAEYSRSMLRYYKKLVENGVAKEIARTVLPQSIYSEAYWTCSFQAVLHFLKQRIKPDAQFEIRQLALAIKNLLQDELNLIGVAIV